MMKRNAIFLTTTIFLITGCYSATSSPTRQISPISSIPVVNATLTPDFTPPIVTLPSTVSTNTPEFGFKNTCLEIGDRELPVQDVAIGTVILSKGLYVQPSFLDLQTNIEYKVSTQSEKVFYFDWGISPNRNLFAITESLQNNSGQFENLILLVVNARAEILEKITFQIPDLYNMHWLDDQNLIIYTVQTPRDGTVMLFNPFTRDQRYISNNLPDFYSESYLLPGLSWLIEYSPSLEWGVYLGRDRNGKLGYVIRDFAGGQTVRQLADAFGEYQRPTWSPNGDEVAVVASGQLYLIDREGQTKSIMDENQQNQVSQPSWSPNGRYIAFWNIYNALMIYDTQSEAVYDLCLKGDYFSPLIWSPDSRLFAIPGNAGDSSTLVDIQENKAYKLTAIPETIYPIGWMNSRP